MKMSRRLIALIIALLFFVAVSASAAPKEKDKDKEKEHEAQKVDAGSFGVYMNGHRLGTETFSIYQNTNGSVIKSEFKTENAPTEAVQTLSLIHI